ncbi:GNAT family N-acetyltransferase [Brevibacterium sp. BRM-1]|uniref:GNAT family N-acetyltransferase n=1 Tax=Brevibacterium sp. BRM-1 TaxID=2999062 RepID=UPI002282F494|nr:GNAT family N-acetyltransferase [Brevibacterium sp. BRM-1]WAL39491.1 GNAT family N-acetyltransferase [Brevibacterium sp. BRM-1]
MSEGTQLATERLVLRRLSPEDAAFVLEVHRSPQLTRFIPGAVMDSVAEARAWIGLRLAEERARAQEQAPEAYRLRGVWLACLPDGPAVSLVILKAIPASEPPAGTSSNAAGQPDDTEIGWRQPASSNGHGYASEAAARVLTAALNSGLERVIAVTHPDNAASQRVCERIGMHRVGRSAAYYDQSLELFEARRDSHRQGIRGAPETAAGAAQTSQTR